MWEGASIVHFNQTLSQASLRRTCHIGLNMEKKEQRNANYCIEAQTIDWCRISNSFQSMLARNKKYCEIFFDIVGVSARIQVFTSG